jgi:hypothetical protein
MTSHPAISDGGPSVSVRAGTGHADGLAAWLGTDDACPVELHPNSAEVPTPGGLITDWSAPCWAVALTYDTARTGLPSGIRAVVHEGSRRLMFDLQDYEILVRVAPIRQSEQYLLEGQVMFEGLPLPGAAVRLDADAADTAVLTDRFGSFRLPPLAQGVHGLQIAVEGAVLAVPPIALR